ncbi:hypothetical protein SteCoe_36521 [Stentor coeruleus]|uniref:TLC domain-containing protein n=1 Tax=Stentor coeruleus TaxID=5963 RepID=A0A1R2AQ62_9CILI|nr:hypothetical protein SteCoe_36521 [Stentor coeruleus]
MATEEASKDSQNKPSVVKQIWTSITNNKIQLMFFAAFTILCPFLGLFLRNFNEVYQTRAHQRPEYKEWPKYIDLGYSFLVSIFLTILLALNQRALKGFSLKIVAKKYHTDEKLERAERLVKSIFKATYFLFSTFFAYFIASNSYFMPASLGGTGEIHNLFKDTPYFSHDGLPYIRQYIIIQLGYHMHSLIVLITSKIRNDFMEMLLHHFVAIMLISLAYLMNYLPVSLLVLYSHDISDFFVSLSRFLVDTDLSLLKSVSFIFLVISWFYTRLIVFPFDLIRASCYENPMINEIYGIEVITVMLHVLLVLHAYWFVLLMKMLAKLVAAKNLVDIQQDLSKKR